MLEQDKSYIAALIDGEGSILISTHPKRGGGFRYDIRIQVAMTDPSAIMWAHDITKLSSLNTNSFKRRTESNKKCYYRWTLSVNDSVTLIKIIFSYLKIKHKQAELLLKFVECRRKTKNRLLRFNLESELATQMRNFNKRGA